MNVSPFYSVINYVQRNSPNTFKFNFPRSNIVWCKKRNVNVVLSSTVKYFSYPEQVIHEKVENK